MLCAMVAGTALVIVGGARREPPATPAIAAPHVAERPWLGQEAAAQIIGAHGALGPLFDGLEVGGPAPAAEARARIAAFARAHDVELELEIVDATLASVRFAVTYGGCCGYEGADVLALRLDRPSNGGCTHPQTWLDHWALVTEDGTYVRASVRVNRVDVRWERALTFAELLARADQLIGMDAASVRAAAAERWVAGLGDGDHLLAVPYAPADQRPYPIDVRAPESPALRLTVEAGTIAEVSLVAGELGETSDARDAARGALRARWGRPAHRSGDGSTWRTAARTVTAELDGWLPRLTIRRP